MSEEAEGEESSIVVVDGDQGSRNLAEDLEDDLECPVVAMDSMDFDLEASEEVLAATVFIVCWDLGIRSGLDLLEEIRRSEAMADKLVLIACEAPTRAIVRLAMESGADGVCTKPYVAEEIEARVAAADIAREAEKAA